jgi:hypothetical protein
MQCPICGMTKPRSSWSRAQWQKQDAMYDHMNGCRECRAPPGPCVRDEQLGARLVVQYARSLPNEMEATVMKVFIETCWLKLPSGYRKKLSHLGAVTSNDVVHPRSWRYGDRAPVFDAGALAPGSVVACTSVLPCEFRKCRVRSGGVPEARYNTAPACANYVRYSFQ